MKSCEKSRLWPILARAMCQVMRVGHIQIFTMAELEESITQEGFEIVESHAYLSKPPRIFFVARKV